MKLARFLSHLVIVVIVACSIADGADVTPAPGTNYITVYGRVVRQGRYELPPNQKPPLTVTGAIAMAGGFEPDAKTKKVKLIRKSPTGNMTIIINADDVLHRGMKEKDITVRPGDVIIVDEKLNAP